jgi:NAD(P)-dependent dehydrogenase (short-subunit alcohol dehydrogenase family)
MSDDTGGETVVIVAAGPGLGLAVARRFAREAASIGLVARSRAHLDELAEGLRADGTSVAVAVADLAEEASLRGALASLRELLGDASVLVFNGSEWVEGRPTEVGHDAFMRGLRVGIGAALVSVQEVAPAMRAAGRGTVLLTGSVAADKPYVGAATVGVAKAGLRNLALSLHRELEPDGVQVATVTIHGVLQGPKALDVDDIADHYWTLHGQPRTSWTAETSYPPS